MKKTDNTHYFLISLIGFLVALVGFVFYMGIFSSFQISEKNVGMSDISVKQYSDNNIYTDNYMDDMYLSAVIEEGIVTQRGVGSYNYHISAPPKEEIIDEDTSIKRTSEIGFNKKSIADIKSLPKPLPANDRFEISLEKANAYPALKVYLEANNLPDTMRVMKIYDNNNKKTVYILSVDPLG